jgi:hypothetical protein
MMTDGLMVSLDEKSAETSIKNKELKHGSYIVCLNSYS